MAIDRLSKLAGHWPIILAVTAAISAFGSLTMQVNYLSKGLDGMAAKQDAMDTKLTTKLDTAMGNLIQAQTRNEDMRADINELKTRVYAIETKH